MALPNPPDNTNVQTIEVDDEIWTIWEVSFRKIKTLWGDELKGLAGRAYQEKKLILINADYPITVRHWTLDHELAHVINWKDKAQIPETMWDELECELMVTAKANPNDFPPYSKEVLYALKSFLASGRNPRSRARMLVNWLRERTIDATQKGYYKSLRLPKAAIRRGRWWERITT